MNSDNKKAPPKLPPCRVCGSKASGYHFGVITCEACKVFFRRYLRTNAPYVCAEEENCELKPGNRGCSYCRLQKCFSLGMSKDGVQKGRYTVEKKSKTIKEVQMLKQQQQAEEMEEHLKVLAEAMIEVYHKNPFVEPDMLKQLPEFQKRYMELNAARETVFGLTIPLSPKLHDDFYKTTGLDVDDRWAAMEKCLGCCQHEVLNDIKYFKQLPCTKNLCTDDMCSLLKAACIDLSLFCSMVSIDPDRMLYTCMTCGCTFGEYEFKMIYQDNDHHRLYNVVKRIKDLYLTDDELAIVIPYIFMSALNDYSLLKQPDRVEKVKIEVDQVLKFVIRNSRGEKHCAFLDDLRKALSEFRDMSRSHSKIVYSFINSYPHLKLPVVVHEIYGNGNATLQEYFSSLQV